MTQVEIYNLALTNIKEPTVQSVGESSHQAETLTVYWQPVIDGLLRRRHWQFARAFSTLVEHADDPPAGWAYRYAMPTDLIRVKRTYTDATTVLNMPESTLQTFSLPYALVPNDAESAMTIVSNYSDLLLEYTKQVTTTTLWPQDFCECVAWGLCVRAVVPLTGRSDLINYCTAGFASAFMQAATHDGNSQRMDISVPDAGSIRARR